VADEAGLRKINIHVIAPPEEGGEPQAFNAGWEHFEGLRDSGREATEVWLGRSFEMVGRGSSFDLKGVV